MKTNEIFLYTNHKYYIFLFHRILGQYNKRDVWIFLREDKISFKMN
jgi:hypothetical protein